MAARSLCVCGFVPLRVGALVCVLVTQSRLDASRIKFPQPLGSVTSECPSTDSDLAPAHEDSEVNLSPHVTEKNNKDTSVIRGTLSAAELTPKESLPLRTKCRGARMAWCQMANYSLAGIAPALWLVENRKGKHLRSCTRDSLPSGPPLFKE